jgi:hypothetical protein
MLLVLLRGMRTVFEAKYLEMIEKTPVKARRSQRYFIGQHHYDFLAYLRRNLSTRPAVSIIFCFPV